MTLDVDVGNTGTYDVNMSAYTGGAYTGTGAGAGTYNTTTGLISGAYNNNDGVYLTGLPLGYHRVRLQNSSALTMEVMAFDILTPIHSYEADSSLLHDKLIGSNSLKAEVGYPGFEDQKKYFPEGVDLGKSKVKWQKKSSTPTSVASTTSVHSFTNLIKGKSYKLRTVFNSSTAATVQLRENGTELTTLYGPTGNNLYSGTVVFTASGSTADVYVSGGTVTRVGGTFISILEELPNHIETDEW